jgi:hypothetical protein
LATSSTCRQAINGTLRSWGERRGGNVDMAEGGAFDRFLAAVARIERLRHLGASPEDLDQAVMRELIALIEALDDSGQDTSGGSH